MATQKTDKICVICLHNEFCDHNFDYECKEAEEMG